MYIMFQCNYIDYKAVALKDETKNSYFMYQKRIYCLKKMTTVSCSYKHYL